MAYGGFQDLFRRTTSDKLLLDKTFNIAKNPKYDKCQRVLVSTVYIFFYKKAATSVDKSAANTSGGAIKSKI